MSFNWSRGVQETGGLVSDHEGGESFFLGFFGKASGCIPGTDMKGIWKGESVGLSKSRRRLSGKSQMIGLFAFSVVIFLVTALVCRLPRGSVLRGGLTSRHLAKIANQEDSDQTKQTSDVEDICHELGIEITDEQENLSADPPLSASAMQSLILGQEDVFQGFPDFTVSLDDVPNSLQNKLLVTSGCVVKRPADGTTDDEEEAQSRWKKARRSSPPAPLQATASVSREDFSETRAQAHPSLAGGALGVETDASPALLSGEEENEDLLGWLNAFVEKLAELEPSSSSNPVDEEEPSTSLSS